MVITVAPRSTTVPDACARGSDTSGSGEAPGTGGAVTAPPAPAAGPRGAAPSMLGAPPAAGTSARCASAGATPGGARRLERSGAVTAVIVRPSALHDGEIQSAGTVVRRTGGAPPSARAFHSAPPSSSHVTYATQRPSGDQAGMNSRARGVAVSRRAGPPARSVTQRRPSVEKAVRPSGAVASCCTRRERTAPVSTRCATRMVGTTSKDTSVEKGMMVSEPSRTPSRWMRPPNAAYNQRPSGEKAAVGSRSREARASSWWRSTG